MNKEPNYFAVIPAEVRYADIKSNAKLLYGELTALTFKEGYCWASDNYFASLYGLSRQTVNQLFRELKENGFIIVETTKDKTGTSRKIFLAPVSKKSKLGVSQKPDTNNTSINNTNNTTKVGQSKDWTKYEDEYGVYNFYRIDHYGYVLLSKVNPPRVGKGDIIKRAKWIYENKTNTKVPKGWHINHINHDKKDDRIENLEILTASDHIKKHHKEGLIPSHPNPDGSYGNVDINTVMDDLYTGIGLKPVNVKVQRIAASNLIKRHGLENTRKLIKIALQLQETDTYASRITSMQDLWNKQNNILVSIKKNHDNQNNNQIRSV
jgi:hypothetical protein